jgi:hypothetical protein
MRARGILAILVVLAVALAVASVVAPRRLVLRFVASEGPSQGSTVCRFFALSPGGSLGILDDGQREPVVFDARTLKTLRRLAPYQIYHFGGFRGYGPFTIERDERTLHGCVQTRDSWYTGTWDLTTGAWLEEAPYPGLAIWDRHDMFSVFRPNATVTVALDGSFIAGIGHDVERGTFPSEIVIADVRSGTAIRRFGASASLQALAIAPGSDRLLSGGSDGLLSLWDVTGRLVATSRVPSAVWHVAFSPVIGDDLVLVSTEDGFLRLFSTEPLREIDRIHFGAPGAPKIAPSVAFLPGGREILVAPWSGRVERWSINSVSWLTARAYRSDRYGTKTAGP